MTFNVVAITDMVIQCERAQGEISLVPFNTIRQDTPYIFRWTESLKKVLKKGLKKVTELKKELKKVMKLKKVLKK